MLAGVVEGVDEHLGLRLVLGDVVADLGHPDVEALVALADREHGHDRRVVHGGLLDLGDQLRPVVVPAVGGGPVRLRGGDRGGGGQHEGGGDQQGSGDPRETDRDEVERSHAGRVPDAVGSRYPDFGPSAGGTCRRARRPDRPATGPSLRVRRRARGWARREARRLRTARASLAGVSPARGSRCPCARGQPNADAPGSQRPGTVCCTAGEDRPHRRPRPVPPGAGPARVLDWHEEPRRATSA